jgi:hypothetical protein
LQIQYGILLSLSIKYIIEQITKIYFYDCIIRKFFTSNVTIELLQTGGGIQDLKTIFFLFIFNLLINANDLMPTPYIFGSEINIKEGIIPEARPTVLDVLNPNDNEQMIEMSKNYYQDFTSKPRIPDVTQIIISANLNDLFKSDFESRNAPSFMDLILNTQRNSFNEFVNQEVKKINLIYGESMKILLEACDRMIELTPEELPVAFFETINKNLKDEVDNMLDEKTVITEELKQDIEKEYTDIAISEHGALKEEPSLYENIIGQFQFSLYSKPSNELVAQETLSREESDKIQDEIEKEVEKSLSELSPEIDEKIFQKKIDKIMKERERDSEAFIYKTNKRVYLDNVCKKAFSKPVSIKFNATTGELILKDKPQSRFHINVLIRNFQHNKDKLLASVRDEPKRTNIVSLSEKSEVMFGLITSFDNDVNGTLFEAESSETIEEYSNKILSFFENLKEGANDALKSNPIAERIQKIDSARNMEEAELESKKIKSESQAEETIAKAELESRITSHNISEKGWKQFTLESKLLSDGIYDTMGTFVNPFFDTLNNYFNNILTKSYSLLILLICFGAWRLGLINSIFNWIKKKLELSIKSNETNKIEREIQQHESEIAEIINDPDRINELEEKIERKRERIARLRDERNELTDDLNSLLEEVKQLREENETLNITIENLRRELLIRRRQLNEIGGKSKTRKNKRIKRNKKSKNNNLKKGKKSKRNNRKKNKCYTKKSI